VRDQYPSESKYDPSKNATANAEEEAENDFTGEPQLDEPTQALPGTEEKIEVMARRAAHRLALFHPQDAVR
jgi:hypothetical protein